MYLDYACMLLGGNSLDHLKKGNKIIMIMMIMDAALLGIYMYSKKNCNNGSIIHKTIGEEIKGHIL